MRTTNLSDGTKVYCLKAPEAKMLDHHVEGYFQHGISIKDDDIIFDVGANIGIFGIRATQKHQNIKIYCFEPIPDIADVLRQNATSLSNGGMIVKQCGLSDAPGNAEFTYFPNTPALSTSLPDDWEHNPKAFQNAVKGTMRNPPREMRWMKLIPTFAAPLIANHLLKGKKQVPCELKTLSSVIEEEQIPKIDLLKVDCEGAELKVLQGISSKHWEMIQSAVIEVHDLDGRLETIKDLLAQNGFGPIHAEREQGLENTKMYNLYATRA
ncbi:MAG: FkbM family methyltransferase [Crocinitomicaceae bacterium]